jgi:hypothetical protein
MQRRQLVRLMTVSRHHQGPAVIQASFRGGARVGWINASWPLATLTANASTLALASLGTYTFAPSDVVSLEPYGSIPFLSSGIQIQHNRRDYPKTVIFWCVGRSRERVLEEIAGTGFRAVGQPIERAPGIAFRWSTILIAIILWNALFLLDRSVTGSQPKPPGPFVLTALVLAFLAATATRLSVPFQRLVLREGHEVGEVESFLVLLQIITGAMAVGFGIALLFGDW